MSDQVRSFGTFVTEIEDGELHADLSRALQSLIAELHRVARRRPVAGDWEAVGDVRLCACRRRGRSARRHREQDTEAPAWPVDLLGDTREQPDEAQPAPA